jgi:hypothetical protein
MTENSLQQRLTNGFKPYGYTLTASDDFEMNNEFRKPDTSLRFVVKPGEGGIILCWTVNPDHDLLTPTLTELMRNMPSDISCQSFWKGPEEFWQAVEDVIAGQ